MIGARVKRTVCTAALVALSMSTTSTNVVAQPAGALPPKAVDPNPLATRPLSPQEMDVLREVEKSFLRYKGQADKHHDRMRKLLFREFQSRKKMLEKRYKDRIASSTALRIRRHLESIALLEKFIKDYPDHEKFTPDAMFRLASLYLDAAENEVDRQENLGNFDALADYSKSLVLWGQILDKFPSYRQIPGTLYLMGHYGQSKDERKSLLLFLSLTCSNKFNWKMEPPKEPTRAEAVAKIENKTIENPYADCVPLKNAEPALVRHAWVRGIGDHHFAVPGELDESIAAYSKVARKKKSELHEESLYKLAWSYYRRDFLLEAAKLFDESVTLYDSIKDANKEPKLDLRKEALDYVAVSFTDPWPEDADETNPVKALERATAFYKGRESEKHVRDFWITLGNAFDEIQAYDQAIASWNKAIGKPWLLHWENPVVHQRIVDAYEAKGDEASANDEGALLATRYAPGTPWYTANESNRKAMQNQRRIAELALYGAARNMHKNAADLRKEWIAGGKSDASMEQDYLDTYAKAIGLYKNFIKQYPASEGVYRLTFYLAEALYFTDRFVGKPPVAARVTAMSDHGNGTYLVTFDKGTSSGVQKRWSVKFLDDAGTPKPGWDYFLLNADPNSSTASIRMPKDQLQKYLSVQLYQEGAVEHYAWVRDHKNLSTRYFEAAASSVISSYEEEAAQQVAAGTIKLLGVPSEAELAANKPQPIPDIYKKLRRAYDKYQQLVTDPKTAPLHGLNAGRVSFSFVHLDDAIKRFDVVFTRFCGKEAAVTAKDAILAIHKARNEGDKFRAINARFISGKCGDAKSIALAQTQNRSLEFKEAENLFAAKRYAEAGLAFWRYYKKAPVDDSNLPLALFNTAVAYREAGKPKTAISLFERFTKEKSPAFRGSPYYLVALRQTAEAYQATYEYDTAVGIYMRIYKIAGSPPRGMKTPPVLPGETPVTFKQIRLEAIYNAASLRELDRKFSSAVSLYKQYESRETNRKRKDGALWSITRIYRQAQDVRNTYRAFDEWRKKYGRDQGNKDKYVASYYYMAKLYAKKGQRSSGARMRKETIAAWNRMGAIKGSRGAEMAGEFALATADAFFKKRWVPYAIKRKPRKIKDAVTERKRLAALRNKTQDLYEVYNKDGRIIGGLYETYGVGILKMAQKVRIGETLMGYANKLYEMPVPREIDRMNAANPDADVLTQWEDGMQNELKPYPVAAKTKWKAVTDLAAQYKINNKWVKLAQENLNKEFPDEFPILHDPVVEGTVAP